MYLPRVQTTNLRFQKKSDGYILNFDTCSYVYYIHIALYACIEFRDSKKSRDVSLVKV